MAGGGTDWRFLPEMPASGRALLLDPPDEGLAASFAVTLLATGEPLPAAASPFDLIALPDGLRVVDQLPAFARHLHPGGTLFISFATPWRRRGHAVATPRQVRRRLRQAGLRPVAVYGLWPDHLRPTYIFPLTSAALRFVFWRVLRKMPAFPRQILTHPFFMRLLIPFLPAYAIIATPAADDDRSI